MVVVRVTVRAWGWVKNRFLVSLRARLKARVRVSFRVMLGVGLVFG